jgi:hypothetical protein
VSNYLRAKHDGLVTEVALHYLATHPGKPIRYAAANAVLPVGILVLAVFLLDYPVVYALIVAALLFPLAAVFAAKVRLRVIDLEDALPSRFTRVSGLHIEGSDGSHLHIDADGRCAIRPDASEDPR